MEIICVLGLILFIRAGTVTRSVDLISSLSILLSLSLSLSLYFSFLSLNLIPRLRSRPYPSSSVDPPYLFSMILSHISLQNLFEKFPKFKKSHNQNCFRPGGRPGRSTGSFPGLAGRPTGRPCLVSRACTFCARLSVDRQKTDCSLFSVGRPTSRPTKNICSLFFVGRPYRLTGPNGYLPDGRPVDRAGRSIACQKPQRLFPLW